MIWNTALLIVILWPVVDLASYSQDDTSIYIMAHMNPS